MAHLTAQEFNQAVGTLAAQGLVITPGANWFWLKPVGAVATFAYAIVASAVVYHATKVFALASKGLRPDTTAPGLIYPLMLLQRYKTGIGPDEELYFKRLSHVTPDEILQDYANQIMEVSHIYQLKQARINLSAEGRFCVTKLWLLAKPVIWYSAPRSDMSRMTLIPSFCAIVVIGGRTTAASSCPAFIAASRVDCSPICNIVTSLGSIPKWRKE